MKRYINKNLYWEIDYIIDTNEIIIHYGIKNHKGRVIVLYKSWDGDEGYGEMEKRIEYKKKKGYMKSKDINDTIKLYDKYYEKIK